MAKFENGKLYLPDGIKNLAQNFDIEVNKDEVKEIYLPKSVKALFTEAVKDYPNLEQIHFNEGLEFVSRNAFAHCPKLKELNFPKSVKSFDLPVLYDCESLEKITIEENEFFSDKGCNCIYFKRDDRVLLGCKNTVIPEGTKELCASFHYAKGLNEVIIPEGVEIVRVEAFSYSDVKKLVIPKSLTEIRNYSFFRCNDLKEIVVDKDNPKYESINGNVLIDKIEKKVLFASTDAKIPEGIEIIGAGVYYGFDKLESVYIPSTVKTIEDEFCVSCDNLKHIVIDKNNPYFSDGSDYLEKDLKENGLPSTSCNVIIDKNTNTLILGGSYSFIPNGVKTIGYRAFGYSKYLKDIYLPNSVEKISRSAFIGCKNLENIVLPNGLKKISFGAFNNTNIKKLFIPASVNVISENAFDSGKLEEIKVDKNNEVFTDLNGKNVLVHKQDMRLINAVYDATIPDGIEILGESSMAGNNREKIVTPKSLVIIGKSAFEKSDVKELVLNDGLKSIKDFAFSECNQLESVNIPQSVKEIGANVFYNCKNLKEKTIYYKTFIDYDNFNLVDYAMINYKYESIKLPKIVDYTNSRKGLAFRGENGECIFPSKESDVVKISYDDLMIKRTPQNQLENVELKNYYKLYEWNKCEEWGKGNKVPHYVIVNEMPVEEIKLFYKDNNKKNWFALMQASKPSDDKERTALFKMAHALGVFSENGAESENAKNFILNEILSEYKLKDIYPVVRNFKSDETPFNPVFAEFFMKYFNGPDFLTYTNEETGEEIDLLTACHNDFKRVQELFPEKKVTTRQDNERLTRSLVIKALTDRQYKNVDERAKSLAEKVGLYGYKQSEFEKLQDWFIQGQQVECVFEPIKSNDDNDVKYEVLSKDNPFGAVLGTATNCCQIVGSAGEPCLRYGMTQPNSTFITFKKKDRLLGQAWVWYDETTGQITLDNIEVPRKVLEDVEKDEELKKSIIKCLNTMTEDLKQSFEKRNLIVNKITVGLGCNDFGKILNETYKRTKEVKLLSGYTSYTDARTQVSLYEIGEQVQLNKVVESEK